MESTITSANLKGAPASLADAVGDFAGGAISLRDVCEILVRQLHNDPSCGGTVQELLGQEVSAGRLSPTDYVELIISIDAALSENVPTESLSDTPDAPGIYKVDGEGTLVLSEDDASPDVPVQVCDSVKSPANSPAKAVEKNQPTAEKNASTDEPLREIGVGYELRGRFRLDEEISRGSMGIVYKAIDRLKLEANEHDPYVAIKLIRTDFTNHRNALKSFQNEIAHTQKLSHPNIIQLFELDRDGDHYFITMELLEGESLDALLDRSKGSALPPTQTYAIIEQLCDALTYAHEQDVIHADIKPGNIFLVKTGELKLIDWGIAVVDASLADGTEAKAGFSVALTPAYASCERFERSAPTAQDDLYSLACMIYRLLAGRRAFGAMTALEAEEAGVEPVPIGGMDPARWESVRRALSFRRQHRQESVREFAGQFGQRRTPRDVEPDEQAYAETMILKKLPENELENDVAAKTSQPADKPIEPPSLFPRGVDPEATSAAPMSASNDTVELGSMDDVPFANNVGAGESQSGAQSLPIDKIEKIPALEMAAMTNDTVLPESIDKTEKIPALDPAAMMNDTVLPESIDKTEKIPELDPAAMANDTVLPEGIDKTEKLPALDLPATMADTVALESIDKTEKLHVPDSDAEAGQVDEVPFVDTITFDESAEPFNILDVDDTGLESLDDAAAQESASAGQEVPFVDTIRIEEPAEPINILDDDDIGLVTLDDAAAQESAPAGQPGEAPNLFPPATNTETKSKPVPVPKVKQPPKQAETAVTPEHSEKVSRQLRGDGQRQVAETSKALPARLAAALRAKPAFAIGSLFGVIVAMIGVGLVLSIDVSLSVSGQANKHQRSPITPSPSAISLATESAARSAGAPLVVDLTASAPTLSAEPVDDFLAEVVEVAIINSESSLSALDPEITIEPLAVPLVNEPSGAPSISAADSEPVSAPTGPSEKFVGMRNKAEKALAEGRLVQPERDNATYWLEQMRAEGGDAVAIIVTESNLIGEFIARAEDAYIGGNMEEANRYVQLAVGAGADDAELAPLRASIAKEVGRTPTTPDLAIGR